MYWDNQYENNERLWEETPSMLALAAAEYLQKTHGPAERMPGVLDIGCGYGRDALYLAGNIRCTVLGVDISEKAIALAKKNCRDSRIRFRCCGFTELEEDFSSFKIKELSEHEYFEPRATGETHHHISWILVGEQG